MYCSNCGGQLTGVESFCSICGSTTMSKQPVVEESQSAFQYSAEEAGTQAEKVNPWETFFTKQADFKGRANRAEYWVGVAYSFGWTFASLFLIGVATVLLGDASFAFLMLLISASWFYLLYLSIVLQIRRLHDMSASGFVLLLFLLPLAGLIFFFVFGIRGSDPPNQYGPPRIS